MHNLWVSLNWRLVDDNNAVTIASINLGDSEIILGTIDLVPPADRDKLGAGIRIHEHIAPDADIKQLFIRARDKGAKIVKGVENLDWGERAFIIHDRDGYNLMIAQGRL
jgi:uncharacterized glyoxalase superfamily protein PhnB